MQEAIKEFQKFAKMYDLSNPNIMRKFHHTFRVVEYAKDIARSEGLTFTVPRDSYAELFCKDNDLKYMYPCLL